MEIQNSGSAHHILVESNFKIDGKLFGSGGELRTAVYVFRRAVQDL